jgi:RHS repeat-associated protein
MGFDAFQCLESVDTYYAGGKGSESTGPGPNYGVTFSSNAQALSDYIVESTCGGSTSNVTNEPSPQNSIIFLSGSAATMNVPAGFTGGFSFYYAAPYEAGFINVWSGLNDTGTLLATLTLPTTGGCSDQPNYCVWSPIGVSFQGIAMSVDFGGTENYIAFDSITLGASVEVNPAKSLGNPSSQPGGTCCGDPISLGNGNLYEHIVDYHTTGPNALAFHRYYNSLGNLESDAKTLGARWRSTYDRYIRILTTSAVTIERADGQEVNFNLIGNVWTPDSDVDMSLAQSGNSWTLTDNDDTVETYTKISSSEALLQSVKARNGYEQTLSYGSSNLLASVTDSYNRSLGFTYLNGLLQAVTTPDGLVLAYGYAPSGTGTVLASVAYSTNPVTSQIYLYENATLPFALTGTTDEDGNRFATSTYDAITGRVLTSQHANGADLFTVAYDDSNNTRTVTNALGVTDTYTFTLLQGVLKVTQISRAATSTTATAAETLTYDGNGFLASKTDWNGNQNTYVNNAHGLPTTINEAVGTPASRTTTIVYDATLVHLPDTLTTQGMTTSFTYDGIGEVLTKTFTDSTTSTVPYATKGQGRTWTNTWSNSLLASVKNPNGNTTKFGYDASGALTSVTDAAGHITTITSHTGGGLPLAVVDPNGVITTIVYSPRQWRISSTVSGSTGTFEKVLTYDAVGNLVRITLPDNSFLANAYDSAHRLVKVTDAVGSYAVYVLDALGDRTQTQIFSSSNTLTWQRNDTFDALGRSLVDTAGAGQTTSRTYDANGNVLTVTDGLKHTTINTYDALNRLGSSTDANGGVTAHAFDAHDRVISAQDANGNPTSYVRDGFGEIIQQSSPDSGTVVFHYDADGNVTSRIDGLGVVTTQIFDILDRPLTTTYPADSSENVAYTYDQTGVGFSFGVGRLTSVNDAAGSATRAYEERGYLAAEKRVSGTTTLSTAYTYDGAGRTASITYPDGTLVTNQYNSAGYLALVSAKPAGASTATTIVTLVHQPFGPVSAVTYGNGIAESWTFDKDYRATGIEDVLSASNLQNLTYAYDNADNVMSITDSVNPSNTQALGYDNLNRLISATSGSGGYGTYSWTYDKVSNRLTQVAGTTTTAYTYVVGTNRLATITTSGQSAQLQPFVEPRIPPRDRQVLLAKGTHSQVFPQIATLSAVPAQNPNPAIASTVGWSLLLCGAIGFLSIRRRRNVELLFLLVSGLTLLAGTAALMVGCAGGSSNTPAPKPVPTAATPVLSPAGGAYTSIQSVTISDSTAGASIYYTTNGSTPTTASTVYSGPISVSATETIEAIATAPGYSTSAVDAAAFTINLPLIITVATNANGNITGIPPANSATNATFAYNNANRLASVSGSPLGATFTYDWLGRRVAKTNPGATAPILYSYLPAGTLIAENDNGVVADYVYADGRPIAVLQPGASSTANKVNYLVADRLGTPQLASNSAGATSWETTLQPFGTTGIISGSITQNLRLPGQNVDVETGFNYNLSRDYMPSLGRYLESDPFGLIGGANPFSYVSQRPLVLTDPLGLWEITITGGEGIAGQISFGNNGGTGGWWQSLFNGQWNLGADVGVGGGASISLNPLNSGCTQTGITGNIEESVSAGDGPISADESAIINSNGSASAEGGIDLPYASLTGTATFNGKSIKTGVAPTIGKGTAGGSAFVGFGVNWVW